MALEDFFTLTEMKDGLTSLSRVKELVTVMQNENDSDVKNVGESTRQWSTVASTIAATANKDCLDLFIQLDGLLLINRCLKDAQNCMTDAGHIHVEESIIALLRALERLQISSEKSITSGIWMTIKNLLACGSSVVHDKARALLCSWEPITDNNVNRQDFDKTNVINDISAKGVTDCGQLENIMSMVRDVNEESKLDPSRHESLPLDCSDASQLVSVGKESIHVPRSTMDNGMLNMSFQDRTDPSDVLNQVMIGKATLIRHVEDSELTETSATCIKEESQMLDIKSVENRAEARICSSLEEKTDTISGDVPLRLESGGALHLENNCEEPFSKVSTLSESRQAASPINMESAKSSDAFHASSREEKWEDVKNPVTLSSTNDEMVVDHAKEHYCDESQNDSENNTDPEEGARNSILFRKRSDMELDYGMVDPLDIARQVAIEVERELDFRDTSCSTSGKASASGVDGPHSPNSTTCNEIQINEGKLKNCRTGQDLSSTGAEPVSSNAETLDPEQESCKTNLVIPSQISEAAPVSEVNTGRAFSGFDLNEDVWSDDPDCPLVPVSKAAAAAGALVTPFKPEGTVGLKESAGTSSSQHFLEGGTLNNSKRCLSFDLNVVENVEDQTEDQLTGKQMIPILPVLPSGEESSIDASPLRSERLNFDLNRVSDSSDVLDEWRPRLLNQNGPYSPRSSESSSLQPTVRKNFDLNDQPFFLNESSSHHPYRSKSLQSINAIGGCPESIGQPAVSIFGSRLEVKGKDCLPETWPVPRVSRITEPDLDINLSRNGGGILGVGLSSLSYGHFPVYNSNGLALGPSMPFSAAMYGPPGVPIPYMVDSRGAPLVPQSSNLAQSPHFMTATMYAGSDGAGPSRHSFDLNPGLTADRGNYPVLMQLLDPGERSSLDEHLRGNLQQPSSSSGVGFKRPEPDSGWESYP